MYQMEERGWRRNCWDCGTELIWGGDDTVEFEEEYEYATVTNLSCPKCPATVEVWLPWSDAE